MRKPAEAAWTATALDDLGAIRVQGPDAVRFLQGQLSNDVTKLSAQRSLLAGFHNPQGRVIALLRLVWLGSEDILAVLPRELATAAAAGIARFVLRAKVKVTDESAHWRMTGLTAPVDELGAPPQQDSSHLILMDSAPRRWCLIAPAEQLLQAPGTVAGDREAWRALDIAAGLPQVYPSTSAAFVAQMLNLDVLGAIAFDKGCYTGQEVIARAHYRGRIKRRMQRFRTRAPHRLAAGDSGQLCEGRGFKVVEAVQLGDGRCEFLAVASSTAQEESTADASVPAAGTEPDLALTVETLSLPYGLPA
jgi:folate-binding protein YgfZ